MLTIYDPTPVASGRGMTRRTLLRVGVLALGGLSLGDVLRLRAASPPPCKSRPKSVIMIFLSGGPSHLDMYDMKPAAPAEYRGEFRPIKTCVPGIDVCELMPRQAKIADKFAVLRGVQLAHLHTANEFYSGYPWQEPSGASEPGEARRPALGSVVSRLRGAGSVLPPYVSLNNPADWERPYYLGPEHEPFRAGDGSATEPLANLGRHPAVSARRLESRKGLLSTFDTLRRDMDREGAMRGLDAAQARALEVIASDKVRDAFDLTREPEKVRASYGDHPFRVRSPECNVVKFNEFPHPGQALLQARRLVEAGVAVVTVALRDWDTHQYNFETLRQLLPPLDQALTALVTDLDERGLLADVAVLMGGEFGRAPRIGDRTPDGRSHWPDAGFLWMAGGGLKTGQIIGATDARGEKPVGNPIRMQNVMATLYRVLDIDSATTFTDFNGRPQYVLEDRAPVSELL
jgi:uncharacterized protein (DUF1501 family)